MRFSEVSPAVAEAVVDSILLQTPRRSFMAASPSDGLHHRGICQNRMQFPLGPCSLCEDHLLGSQGYNIIVIFPMRETTVHANHCILMKLIKTNQKK